MARQKSVGSQELPGSSLFHFVRSPPHCPVPLSAFLLLSDVFLSCSLLLFFVWTTTTPTTKAIASQASQAPHGQRHTFDKLLHHNSFAFLNAKSDIRVSYLPSSKHLVPRYDNGRPLITIYVIPKTRGYTKVAHSKQC
jgi:hypothetical protein